jgi:ribose 1,5-bisphosphokinase
VTTAVTTDVTTTVTTGSCHRGEFHDRQGRLIYLMGASGSGKDSLLHWLTETLPPGAPVVIARRAITRAESLNESAEAVSPAEFERCLQAGRFALHWRSHGLSYGIGTEIDTWLADGKIVIVNGSRGYLSEACERYPGLLAVEVVVSRETLKARLLSRGRETPGEIEKRLDRADLAFDTPTHCTVTRIRNDGALAQAGEALLALTQHTPTHV